MLRKNIIITIISIIIVLMIGLYGKSKFIDKGLGDVNKISDLDNIDVSFSSMAMYNEEDIEILEDTLSYSIQNLNEAEYIFIVEPIEEMSIERDILLQDVKIKKVIRGNDIEEDIVTIQSENTFIHRDFEISTMDENGEEVIVENEPRTYYLCTDNIMRIGKEYLVFADENELNKYNKKKFFSTEKYINSILCLDKNVQSKTLLDLGEKFYYQQNVDNENYYDGVSVKYGEVKDFEFFTTSGKVLDMLYYQKEQILKAVGIEIS